MPRLEDIVISCIVSGKQMRYFTAELVDALYPTIIEEIKAKKCPFCGRVFKFRRFLKKHLLQVHSEDLKNIADNVLKVYKKFKTATYIKKWQKDAIIIKVNSNTLTFSSKKELIKFIAENFA